MKAAPSDTELRREVQGLALTSFGARCARSLLLTVVDAAAARRFIAALLDARLLTFGGNDRIGTDSACAVNIGFSWEGMRALGAPERVLAVLKDKSLAFAEGATRRATRCLGDAGESAVERWDPVFRAERAHVWIAIHGADTVRIADTVAELRSLPDAVQGLAGWELKDSALDGAHLEDKDADGKTIRKVHFGFRDNLTKPKIDGLKDSPKAGELLLGYPNNDDADLWTAGSVEDDIVAFLRNGSFGILRKIQQFEDRLEDYLQQQVDALSDRKLGFLVTKDFLKAKMCGRWPNGAPVRPNETEAPQALDAHKREFDFRNDPKGLGCPYGSHVRRTNPRTDDLTPERHRILFRRGIPYGPLYKPSVLGSREAQRGLLGVFFCARIEDQFEHLVSEWIEKNPLGPPNRGRAKDPLVGRHDEPEAEFHIPLPGEERITLKGLAPFVRTRGTLYALFPSRQALQTMASDAYWNVPARAEAPAPSRAQAQAEEAVGIDEDEDAATDAMDAPSDRFCDIVMEGGITSGIIYTSAVVELGRHYRFRNIGGSSIGAFAAALTAAAEYQRRKGAGEGFEMLATLPEKLAEEDDGRTRLERAFVPQRRTRRLFNIFLATLDRRGSASVLFWGLDSALWQYRWLVGIVTLALLAVVLAGPLQAVPQCRMWPAEAPCYWAFASWSTALLLTLCVSVGGALLAGLLWDITHGLVPNDFGLCRGWEADNVPSAESLDLAAFLHGSIQQVAGRHAIDEPPLTFRDLWNAPGSAAQALGYEAHGDAAGRSINLEVYASNLAHSRPYRFPLEEAEDMGRLFFRVEELERFFPKGIVHYLAAFSRPYVRRSRADPPSSAVPAGYLELPVADMPIVIAVRLAMSFPLLISAVPLYAINHDKQSMERCWMSDGGLCSNFPIHLFDSFVPKWPTFGISLHSRGEGVTRRVWLPEFHTSGRGDTWDSGPDRSASSLGRLGGFLVSLWKTTWRWNDSTMMRMPGVRDRVVRIYLDKGEGGVNIRMRADKIRMLADSYGKEAARAFVRKFRLPTSRGWDEHRWVRLNCLMVSLRERVLGLREAMELNRHTAPLAAQIDKAARAAPLRKPERRSRWWPSEKPLDAAQVAQLQAQLEALQVLEDAFKNAGAHETFRAVPRSSMRIRHPT